MEEVLAGGNKYWIGLTDLEEEGETSPAIKTHLSISHLIKLLLLSYTR